MRRIRTELQDLQLQQLLSHVALHGTGEGEWQPPTDVYETETEFIVHMEIPGMKREEIQIHFAQPSLAIWGERRSEEPCSNAKMQYIQMEVNYGRFRREITFFKPVKPEGLQARYANGFLKVVLPKL
ncbi:Hsp20/alpha crystallin family protein [Candidatus Acetothermia bacterium]|nr:Hsp20/alpha crystallin family protein [Candidatus Acetothermia bacterium]MBI3460609.1 Hsp20/alpha crystallin family protein [Candidatus Acetothermia bacterium]MBI3660158.1 Hsp20/alpha crystallin family protein [Candidatus Acetothermia bacterium]